MVNIARMAFPFLRKALGVVGNIAVNTAGDLINDENKTIGQTLVNHTLNETKNALAPSPSRGRGLKRIAPRSINRGGISKRGNYIV